MKKSVCHWQMGGFIFTGIFGTFLHFLFDLTGGSAAAGLFSAVNESIWEHMKLLFYPMVVFAIIEYLAWGREDRRFWTVKLVGIFTGLLLIPVLYYTYTGALGVSADWFNITIFFLTAGAVYRLETRLFEAENLPKLPPWVAVGLICLVAAVFTLLTFFPPHIPLFRDPQTGSYGLNG